ncbi:hypothetical protein [Candidatus Villigracilis affinis]|uniref:hypothetical protein n=1 Tax=Candidatus Villigracilis affinis TaxID=3140682 RepID=UPI002A209DBE|nr:hypothetical protein [Anaerolineales bacterium]
MSTIKTNSREFRWMAIWERYNSLIIWLLLVAYLGLASFLVTVVFPVQFVDRSQSGLFEPQAVIAIGVMGLIGVWLSMRTGFPNAWDAKVSNKQRLIIPIITGLLLGSLFLATDLITDMSRLQEEQLNIKSTDVAFPASIFVYSAGAIFVEVLFRLLTIPLLLGMISIFVRSQSAREKVFWMLAILTSIIEPLTNTAASQVLAPLALTFVLVQSFSANFLQAVFFRKYGFVAAILLRVAFYIPTHVIGSFLK